MVIKPKDAKGSQKITSYFNKRSQPMSEPENVEMPVLQPVSKRPKLTDRDAAPTPFTNLLSPIICDEKLCPDHHKNLMNPKSYTGPYRDQAEKLQKRVKSYQTHNGDVIPCNGVPKDVVQKMRNGERVE